MKFKNCLWIALSAVALSGCSSGSSSSDPSFNTTTMTAAYNFWHLEKEGVPVAVLLFNDTYFSGGLTAVQRPDFKLIAGDRLVLKYTGALITQESSPGVAYIAGGELKDYYFIKTDVIERKETTAQEIRQTFSLRTDNIILDDEGHFTSIDQYEGSDYYLTFDKERVVPCPDGANCAVQLTPVAGMYAFNPRP